MIYQETSVLNNINICETFHGLVLNIMKSKQEFKRKQSSKDYK